MASVTLNVGATFPAGTSVSAYPQASASQPAGPPASLVAAATATVSSASTLTFTGLTEGASYWAGANISGTWRYIGFSLSGTSTSRWPSFGDFDTGEVPQWDAVADQFTGVDVETDVDFDAFKASLPLNIADYGAVGDGSTDDAAAIQAAVDELSTTYGGAIVFPPGKKFKIGSAITLPRITAGSLIIDLNGSTLYSDQAISMLSCVVPRTGSPNPTTLVGQCIDWEIRNGTFLGTGVAGQRGIQIEASYNLRFHGLHFSLLEIGEETRFGMMHADVGCRYTNCTIGAFHGGGKVAGHVDATTAINGATITVPTTYGFDSSGSLTWYDDAGANATTVTYTGRTATMFTGCAITAGALTSVNGGGMFKQTLWTNATDSDGCNGASHHGRHYCGSGAHAALMVNLSSDGSIAPGTIFEGNAPKWCVYYDTGRVSTMPNFTVYGPVHVEYNPTLSGSVFRVCGQNTIIIEGVYLGSGNTQTFVDARWCLGNTQIVLRDWSVMGNGGTLMHTAGANVNWLIENMPPSTDFTSTANWNPASLPTYLSTSGSRRTYATEVRTPTISNSSTGTPAVTFAASEVMQVRQDTVRFRDSAGTNEAFVISGAKIGFFNAGAQAKKTISGSRGGNAALASLLGALSDWGLITDSTSA